MADTKITNLTDGDRAQYNDELPINRVSGPNVDRKVSTLNVAKYAHIDHFKRGVAFFDDFVSFLSLNGGSSDRLGISFGGTGASVTNGMADADHPGVITLSTGTTTTGRCSIFTDAAAFLFGGGTWVFETLFRIEDLSDATNEYDVRIGFGDSATGDHTDGAYFEYDRNTRTNWSIVTASNGVRTRSDSGVAVAADTWIKLRIEVNAAGNSVSFFIDGTETTNSPISTNIPTGAGRLFGLGIALVKSAGTTARLVYSDYLFAEHALTNVRS